MSAAARRPSNFHPHLPPSSSSSLSPEQLRQAKREEPVAHGLAGPGRDKSRTERRTAGARGGAGAGGGDLDKNVQLKK